ncbi:MAG: energy transducer TonB, partial [Acidobacteriaceae bacterium]|nr:energy transducer TonB [Acidobacteriaceae bacterium]
QHSCCTKTFLFAAMCLVAATLFVVLVPVFGTGMAFDLPEYTVEVAEAGSSSVAGAFPKLLLTVLDKYTGSYRRIEIENGLTAVARVFSPVPGRLVAIGPLQGGGAVFSLMELNSADLVDTVWAWDYAISPNNKYAAYEFRYPPHGLPAFRSAVLLLYDFSVSPNEIPRVGTDRARKGFILYPAENREKDAYQVASQGCCGGSGEAADFGERIFTSPIAWDEDSRKIAVVESFKHESYLIVVDIAGGPFRPVVTQIKLDLHLFETERGLPDTELPQQDRQFNLLIRELVFQSSQELVLRSRNGGPFAEKTVSISLPDQKQAILKETLSPSRLTPPPGMPYIRLSGMVEEAAAIFDPKPSNPTGEVGTVSCDLLISPDGHVLDVKAVSGPQSLVSAAQTTLAQWTFKPVMLAGRPVAVLTNIDINFGGAK